ncbi:undecaprenyl-phosphate glucose phosphotransferase [Salinisphaera sp. Q1T1-3]|uniref:undecaprenyl-phosphate glucose phosphotransferase n=1 Tax=Salinisphaera sp. Q1T1-3 TaxID=2321229 RepID=UPI0018F3D5EB|nr:undecaprenyl-phosphate glucose phosphotransferase [Salinisphaera sp. Q1T1-3]
MVDLLMIVVGAYVAYVWCLGQSGLDGYYRGPVLVGILLTLSVFPALGLYDSWRGRSPIDQMRAVTVGWFGVILGLILIGFALKQSANYSRLWVVTWGFWTWALLVLGRFATFAVLRQLRIQGWNHRRILIVGNHALAEEVLARVESTPSTGWEVIAAAMVDHDGSRHVGKVRVVGYRQRIERLARRFGADEIWLCLPLEQQALIDRVRWDFRHSTITMRLVPNLHGMRLIQHPVAEILGVPMLNLSVSPMQGWSRLIKALEDRALAFLILTMISPVLLVLAIGVKMSSPGPIFFRQKRMGWNGRLFTILKFRSMPVDVESKTGAVWAKAGEKRSTKFGSFLRRTSLDELPQFINVLLGNMSIVGPRPERPVFVDQFKEEIPGYMQKHMVKAGITGWAQVNGWRGSTDLQKRIEHDLYYIEHWSFWFDLKIIFLTVFKGFISKNAY